MFTWGKEQQDGTRPDIPVAVFTLKKKETFLVSLLDLTSYWDLYPVVFMVLCILALYKGLEIGRFCS